MKYLFVVPFFWMPAVAQAADYTLFNPTSDSQMRAMSTERPTRTDSAVTVDPGLIYAVSKNMTLDTGVNIGATRAADDVNAFVGGAIRFRIQPNRIMVQDGPVA